jgi:hypothetical protein
MQQAKEKYTGLHGRMEGYNSVSSRLKPAFEADDQRCPAKGKASDSNSNIKKHHNICRENR